MMVWVISALQNYMMGLNSGDARDVSHGSLLTASTRINAKRPASNRNANNATNALALSQGTRSTTGSSARNGCGAQITGDARKSWSENVLDLREGLVGLLRLAETSQMMRSQMASSFVRIFALSAEPLVTSRRITNLITDRWKWRGFASHAMRPRITLGHLSRSTGNPGGTGSAIKFADRLMLKSPVDLLSPFVWVVEFRALPALSDEVAL